VFWTITLPLIRPAILSGAFLVFAATAASFGVPALVGNPGGVHVLTTRIYSHIRSGSIDGPFMGAALSTSLFLVAIVASVVADRFSHSRRITSMGGKSARISRVSLGKWKWPAFGFIFTVFILTCLLPLVSILLTSFMQVPGLFDTDNLTLGKYHYVLFERRNTGRGFLNSFVLAASAACLAVGVGTALAYLKGHPRRRSGPLIDLCVNLPYATPGTILALGLMLTWSGRINLADTLWILLIAYFAKYLSFAVKALTTNVQQIDPTLEEASRMSGAGFTATILRIWLPLLRPGMLASWFLIFMPAFSELTMSVLLVGPGTETVGTALFYLQEYGDPSSASVLAMLILLFVLGAYALAMLFGPRTARSGVTA
jgi:iron(III) transport system permease protein